MLMEKVELKTENITLLHHAHELFLESYFILSHILNFNLFRTGFFVLGWRDSSLGDKWSCLECR